MAHLQSKVATVVSNKPVRLQAFIVTPDAGQVGDITLYSGRDSSGESLGTYQTGAGITLPVILTSPVVCDRGLYLSVGSHILSVLLIWEYITE